MIHRQEEGSIVTIKLAHGKANTMDVASCRGLTDALTEIDRSPARAAILTAEGSIFSAGVDLPRLLEGGAEYLAEFLPALEGLFRTVLEFEKPLVGAINGHAIAGGCVLAAGCDHRVMAAGTGRIGVPELLVGLPFPSAAFELMRLVAPPHRLAEVALQGRTYPPEEALTRGLIDEIAEPSDLLEVATSHAERLAQVPAATFTITKRQIRRPVLSNLERYAELDSPTIANIWGSPGARAAIQDYVNRVIKK